jgi:hypothetical protein
MHVQYRRAITTQRAGAYHLGKSASDLTLLALLGDNTRLALLLHPLASICVSRTLLRNLRRPVNMTQRPPNRLYTTKQWYFSHLHTVSLNSHMV